MSAASRVEGRIIAFRFLLGLAMFSLLFSAQGCAPKNVRQYAPSPASGPKGDIVDYAITLLGKHYRNGAKGPDTFDCSGFVYHVYGRFNIPVPVSTAGLNRAGYEISREDIVAGDLAIFKISREYHVGIMINKLEFVHASKSRGVAIDSVDAPYWKRNFSHFRRIL
jgi:cell wall-associated NlpC family hydrolase